MINNSSQRISGPGESKRNDIGVKSANMSSIGDLGDASYWKQKYEEVKFELEEFQESSRELEQELETQLAQSEKKIKNLESSLSRSQTENESLKSKLTITTKENTEKIHQLQEALSEYQAVNDKLSHSIRELEQSNDDLERAKRALVASLEDFESRLNHQIEKNVLLENELGEKEELEVVVQRLKDEARDLRYELTVQRQKEPNNKTTTNTTKGTTSSNIDPRRSSVLSSTDECSTNSTPAKSPSSTFTVSNKPRTLSCLSSPTGLEDKIVCSPLKQPRAHKTLLSPSTRISALNMVSDLLRKIGALESKLDSCRYSINNQPM